MNTTIYCQIENYRRDAASAMQVWQRLLQNWPSDGADENAWRDWARRAQEAENALSRCLAQIDATSHRMHVWPTNPAITMRSRPRASAGRAHSGP